MKITEYIIYSLPFISIISTISAKGIKEVNNQITTLANTYIIILRYDNNNKQ